MTDPSPILHMLCGKIAAGKSTLAASLASAPATVLIAEDDWLNALFADELASLPDHVRCCSKPRQIMAPHGASLLNAGVSVVLDFPANTVEHRRWMRSILEETTAAHQLHLLDASNEVCLARLRARNRRGDHPFAVTEAWFHQISGYFAAPAQDEGFTIVTHDEGG
jgi:predicted kinase